MTRLVNSLAHELVASPEATGGSEGVDDYMMRRISILKDRPFTILSYFLHFYGVIGRLSLSWRKKEKA